MIRQQFSGRNSIKQFVLDTNVILHDSACIRNFEEHDIIIPIAVLEELDQFKKGHGDIHFHARQFLRELDELTGDVLSRRGASLGEEQGNIRVVMGRALDERLRIAFVKDSPDHRIINSALSVQEEEPQRQTIVVSKDTNLRMKAKALGLLAQDYITDHSGSENELPRGKHLLNDIPEEVIQSFYDSHAPVPADELPMIEEPGANEFYILKNGSKSVLTVYRKNLGFERIQRIGASGIQPLNAEQSFAITSLMDDDIRLVTLAGKAGSGKTLVALAAALERRSAYRQILLARPIVPLSNRDLGFLPGDVSAKLDPYMQPLFDNLTLLKQVQPDGKGGIPIDSMVESGKLEVSPLAYIRGRTLHRVFFIVDEAQNLTPHEIKTIVTRAGEGTKIVFTGDVQQIDHPYLDSRSNGLSYLIQRMKGHPLYSHITLEKGERSELAELASNVL